MEPLEETGPTVYVPALYEGLGLLMAAYGVLPVLLGTILMALTPRSLRGPVLPPPEPESPDYGPVGFVHFD